MPYQMDYVEPAPLDRAGGAGDGPDARRRAPGDRRLPARRRPAACRRCSFACPTTSAPGTRSCRRSRRYVTDRGYVLVVQDVRGKFRSEGETMPFMHEVDDGYDTLEWIVAQPWSDGVVGMWGDSYYGYTQWAAVASGHPALQAPSSRA